MNEYFNKEEIIKLRHKLHQLAELSGKEVKTAKFISEYLKKHNPNQLIENLGGHGLAAVFKGKEDGPVIVFRADMDALPIDEHIGVEYKSLNKGVAHKCGHDGHMASLASLAKELSESPPKKGTVVLLFQPAEETGQGAKKIVDDPRFWELKPNYIFGYHNIPSIDKETVLITENVFSSASIGIEIKLKGKTAHAAQPETGFNPSKMIADLIYFLTEQSNKKAGYKDFTLVTIVHVNIGEIAFGTSAGEGVIMATLRSFKNEDMLLLKEKISSKVKDLASNYNLTHEISYHEEFFALENQPECTKAIHKAAVKANKTVYNLKEPFRWSEDFSCYTMKLPGAFFGIGAGKETADLHNPTYDFPDDLIPTANEIFRGIWKQILE